MQEGRSLFWFPRSADRDGGDFYPEPVKLFIRGWRDRVASEHLSGSSLSNLVQSLYVRLRNERSIT